MLLPNGLQAFLNRFFTILSYLSQSECGIIWAARGPLSDETTGTRVHLAVPGGYCVMTAIDRPGGVAEAEEEKAV